MADSEKPSNYLGENEYAVAIVDDYFREGHCTVILKRHIKSISEMEPAECTAMFALAKRVAKALEKKYNCEKTYLVSIGDMCEHLHFHLIPKHRGLLSMGKYCFEKMAEAEGERNPDDARKNALAGEIRAIMKSVSP
jgi:diadenosine tetraphosphate (Ap4A) HIT family hydrolase